MKRTLQAVRQIRINPHVDSQLATNYSNTNTSTQPGSDKLELNIASMKHHDNLRMLIMDCNNSSTEK